MLVGTSIHSNERTTNDLIESIMCCVIHAFDEFWCHCGFFYEQFCCISFHFVELAGN